MTSECISVVVPVYNEDENIGSCLRALWSALAAVPHEILVCYDFDEDRTLPAIAAMPDRPPSVRLVKNDLGRGAAYALRAGFDAARGDVVITTMADLSDPPDVIHAMAAKIRASGATIVSGSRYMKGGSLTGGPFVKRTLSRWACLSLNWLAGVGTHDATNNFRAYRPEFLRRTEVESEAAFDIALELTVKAHLAGEPVTEVPSTWVDRSAGESRFQVWNWAPKYLRWWWKAAGPPVVFLLVMALSLATLVARAREALDLGGALALAGGLALLALGCAALARRQRGRTAYADVLFAVLWTHPGHEWFLARGWLALDLALTGVASLALLALGSRSSRPETRSGARTAAPPSS